MPHNRTVLAFLAVLASLGASVVWASSPARVDCEVLENGKPSMGSYRLLAGSDQIAKGSCGRPAETSPGRYELEVTLDGAVDAPAMKQRIEARVGELTKAKASFETGEILVELTRDGHRTVGTIRLLRGKDAVATLTAGVVNRVSVGTYGVEIESRGTRRTIEAVTVGLGARRSLSEDFSASGTRVSP